LQDVELVDFGGADKFDMPSEGVFDDLRVQGFAAFFRELFGVTQAGNRARGVEDDGGDGQRARQGAASGFVHAGDPGHEISPAMAAAAEREAFWRSCRWSSR